MESRINGTLKTWNKDKGFGFITPLNGGQDIFVHIADFPKQGGLPKVGEPLSFEIILNKDGKKKAVLVQRPGVQPAATKVGNHRKTTTSTKHSLVERFIMLVVVVIIGVASYTYLAPKFNTSSLLADTPVTMPSVETPSAVKAPSRFQCDGRLHCSQMTSCEEATYFIRNCPNTQMDGDGDGVPCESQWCTHPFAK
jgi:cold shock CspA family protein